MFNSSSLHVTRLPKHRAVCLEYGPRRLTTVHQNGRCWRCHLSIAGGKIDRLGLTVRPAKSTKLRIARGGNSNPSTMVDAVAQLVFARISAHQELFAARREGEYVWMALPMQLHCTYIVATILLICTSKAPFQILPINGLRMPGALQPSSPERSLGMATWWQLN